VFHSSFGDSSIDTWFAIGGNGDHEDQGVQYQAHTTQLP